MRIGYAEGKLEGDWAVFAKIAGYFVYKVLPEDREDFLHNLLVEMDKVKAKYAVRGKPLTEASLMMVAKYELKAYWEKRRYRLFGLNCYRCTIEQRRECQATREPSECPKKRAHRIVSLNKIPEDGDGDGLTELGDLIADDKPIDLDAWLDAKLRLEHLPPSIVRVGKKLVRGDPLTANQRLYLSRFRKGETKPNKGIENYHRLRVKGLCVHCGEESGKFSHCPKCQERYRVFQKKHRENKGQAWINTLRDYWRRQGRCPRCGGVPKPGYKTCPACLAKNRKYLQRHRERIASPGQAFGLASKG